MIEKAMSKIKAEMDQKSKNSYVTVIGSFLVNHIKNCPEDAEKIVSSSKTIEGSLDEMKKEAEKRKVGNCAVLTDEDGFAIVLQYFGLMGKAPKFMPEKVARPEPVAPIPTRQIEKVFSIDLDDLL